MGVVLGCGSSDKGFHAVRNNPAEEYSSDLQHGARLVEVDSGVMKRPMGGAVGGRFRGSPRGPAIALFPEMRPTLLLINQGQPNIRHMLILGQVGSG